MVLIRKPRQQPARIQVILLLYKQPILRIQHYIFGYGSLIHPMSRLKSMGESQGYPALVKGYLRKWNYNCNNRYTAVGVERRQGYSCNGVITRLVCPSDLIRLDKREACYVRKRIKRQDIQWLQPDVELDDHCIIWVYQIKESPQPHQPSPSVPLPQSYLDCILSGCLLYGTSFARMFLTLTLNWPQQEAWMNDRWIPLQDRKYKIDTCVGETDPTHQQASEIDGLLSQVLKRDISQLRRDASILP